jgi:hypothetical protein
MSDIYGEKSFDYRRNDFSKLSVEKQYAIYICGNQVVHPPMMYLGELFAREGEKIIGFLKVKLRETDDDATIRDLVRLFSEMSRLGTYDVAKDDELMRLISVRLAGMKDPGWREVTEQMVNRIKE